MNNSGNWDGAAGKTDLDWCERSALWWIRNFEKIIHFWTGFSWVIVIGAILTVFVGRFNLSQALSFIICFGVVANTGLYLCVKAFAASLKQLREGPEKEEAHELMGKIIHRRLLRSRMAERKPIRRVNTGPACRKPRSAE